MNACVNLSCSLSVRLICCLQSLPLLHFICFSFSCPVVFELTCRVLAAYIAARTADITEKSHNTVMLSFRRNPQVSHVGVMEHESEELRSAMCAAEDSLAIQMLIETCLPTKEEVRTRLRENASPVHCDSGSTCWLYNSNKSTIELSRLTSAESRKKGKKVRIESLEKQRWQICVDFEYAADW